MDIDHIINQIYQDLQKEVDPTYKEGATRYFKESITLYGVRTPNVRAIAKKYAALLKNEPVDQVWHLSEQLLQSNYIENATIALALVYKHKKQWKAEDFKTLERWLHAYVSNWAICDDLSAHLIGYCITAYPQVLPTVHSWAISENRWVRRSASVSLVVLARNGKNLDDVWYVADALKHDTDDLVQKGCGWMLKEASKCCQADVVAFIEKYKHTLPRTTLRYAIELLPVDVKKELMKKIKLCMKVR